MIKRIARYKSGLAGLAVLCAGSAWLMRAAGERKITSQKDLIGFTIGDDYHMANYTQISTMLKKWSTETDRMKLVSIGNTEEGRVQYMAIISAPENLAKLDHYKEISHKLAIADGVSDEEAHNLAQEGKAVVWIHAA